MYKSARKDVRKADIGGHPLRFARFPNPDQPEQIPGPSSKPTPDGRDPVVFLEASYSISYGITALKRRKDVPCFTSRSKVLPITDR